MLALPPSRAGDPIDIEGPALLTGRAGDSINIDRVGILTQSSWPCQLAGPATPSILKGWTFSASLTSRAGDSINIVKGVSILSQHSRLWQLAKGDPIDIEGNGILT